MRRSDLSGIIVGARVAKGGGAWVTTRRLVYVNLNGPKFWATVNDQESWGNVDDPKF